MRRIIFWIHLVLGITAGLVIVLMSFTGLLLSYEKQVLAWLDRGTAQISNPGNVPTLPMETLLRNAKVEAGTSVTLRRSVSEPVELIQNPANGSIYLDPRTGAQIGRSSWTAHKVFTAITSWHRRLGVDGPARNTARLITGGSSLLFLLMILTGAILWLPRKWSLTHLRPIIWFRPGLEGKARDFNWHNTIGLWCALPLVVIVLGALPISFVWANNLAYRIMGNEPPAPPAAAPARPAAQPRAQGGATPPAAVVDGLNARLEMAKARQPEWRSLTFRVPSSPSAPLSFAIDWGTGGQPQRRGTLTIDGAGKSEKWETFEDNNAGRRLRLWLRFLHTGEALGLAGQAAAAVASAGATVLGWTGIALALQRWTMWRRPREKP